MLKRLFNRLPSPDKILTITDVKAFMTGVHLAHYTANGEQANDKPLPSEGVQVVCVSKNGGDGGYPQFKTIPYNSDKPSVVYSMNWRAFRDLKDIGIKDPEKRGVSLNEQYQIKDLEKFKKMVSTIVDELQNKVIDPSELNGMIITYTGLDQDGHLTFQPSIGVSNVDIKITTRFKDTAPLKQCGLAPYVDPHDKVLGIERASARTFHVERHHHNRRG